MPDSQNITDNLLLMYGENDLLMRLNSNCFFRISGLYNLPRYCKVLDCGCATGHLLRLLHSRGFNKIYGLDASLEMVKLARRYTGKNIIHCDVLDIAKHWAPSSLDAVVVSCLMHHMASIQEWDRFMSACNIVLKKGGLLIFREPAQTIIIKSLHWMSKHKIFYFSFFKVRLQSFVEEDQILQYFFKHWSGSYKNLINKNGFKIKKDMNWFVHRITACEKL